MLPQSPPATIGEAARLRLDEVAQAAKKNARTETDGTVAIEGPCTFTNFPSGEVHWIKIEKGRSRLQMTGSGADTARTFWLYW